MVRVELHADEPDRPDMLQKWLGLLKEKLLELELTTELCEFKLERNSPELIRTGKCNPFIRLVVTRDDHVGKIVQSIGRFLPEFDGFGIDIVTMPVYLPPGVRHRRWDKPPRTGRWYDPDDILKSAEYHSRKAGEERG